MSSKKEIGFGDYVLSRIVFVLLLLSIGWLVLACTTNIQYRKIDSPDLTINKVEKVRTTYNDSNVSYLADKVTFSYDNGNIQVTEKYRLNNKKSQYLYNKLVNEHIYYKPCEIMALLLVLALIATTVAFFCVLFMTEGSCFSKYTYEESKFFERRSKFLIPIMQFCGYTNITKEPDFWKFHFNYTNEDDRIPSYRRIWKYLKESSQKEEKETK